MATNLCNIFKPKIFRLKKTSHYLTILVFILILLSSETAMALWGFDWLKNFFTRNNQQENIQNLQAQIINNLAEQRPLNNVNTQHNAEVRLVETATDGNSLDNRANGLVLHEATVIDPIILYQAVLDTLDTPMRNASISNELSRIMVQEAHTDPVNLPAIRAIIELEHKIDALNKQAKIPRDLQNVQKQLLEDQLFSQQKNLVSNIMERRKQKFLSQLSGIFAEKPLDQKHIDELHNKIERKIKKGRDIFGILSCDVHKNLSDDLTIHTKKVTRQILTSLIDNRLSMNPSSSDNNQNIKYGPWLSGSYSSSAQEGTEKISPYTTNSLAINTGFDIVLDGGLLGISYSHVNSKIIYKKFVDYNLTTDIFALYGSKLLSENLWLQIVTSISNSKFDGYTIRPIANSNVRLTTNAKSVDFNFISKLNYKIISNNGAIIIPNIALRYESNLRNNHNERLREGNLSLSKSLYSKPKLIGTLGATVQAKAISLPKKLDIIPKIHFSLEKNLNNNKHNTEKTTLVMGCSRPTSALTSKRFINNANSMGFNLGGSLSFQKNNKLIIDLYYNYNFDNIKYSAHLIMLKLYLMF